MKEKLYKMQNTNFKTVDDFLTYLPDNELNFITSAEVAESTYPSLVSSGPLSKENILKMCLPCLSIKTNPESETIPLSFIVLVNADARNKQH